MPAASSRFARLRRKWAAREGVTCYRVYDADLPDYAAAIDLFEGAPETPGRWLVIAEYAAPKTIDPELAHARMTDILAIAPRVLGVAPDHVHARERLRAAAARNMRSPAPPMRATAAQAARRPPRSAARHIPQTAPPPYTPSSAREASRLR